ncbi:unnamed protein product, partial [Nesidiocoris tenuis]
MSRRYRRQWLTAAAHGGGAFFTDSVDDGLAPVHCGPLETLTHPFTCCPVSQSNHMDVTSAIRRSPAF